MNRAARRKSGIRPEKPIPTYNMSRDQVVSITQQTIIDELEKAKKDAINYAVKCTVAIMLSSLHEVYGFGPIRLQRTLKKFNDLFDNYINAEVVEIDEYIKACEKSFGIEFK